jgi:GT2 family glycosyltransferase
MSKCKAKTQMSKSQREKKSQRLNRPEGKAGPIGDLDVIVPVYGRPDLLQRCLASLEATRGTLDLRLILVDDASPEPAALEPIYAGLNGRAKLLRNRQNSGFPRTINRGVARGFAPLVLLLNTDIELQPGCLQAMIAEFADPQVGVIGPKLLFPPDSLDPHRPAGKIQHAGMAVNFRGQFIHANIGWSADHPKVNERRVVQAVTGACLMTRRSLWVAITKFYRSSGDPTTGALNEIYGRGTWEDVEYCFAVRGQGCCQVIYTPNAIAYHAVGGSSAQVGQGYPLARNEMIFRARCGHLLAWDEFRFC